MVTMESKTSDVGSDDDDTFELTTVLSGRTYGTLKFSRKFQRIKGTRLQIKTSVFNGDTLADYLIFGLSADQLDQNESSTTILDPFPIREGGFLSQSGKKTGDIAVEWPTERPSNRRGGIITKSVKENISKANGNPVDIVAGNKLPVCMPPPVDKPKFSTAILDPFPIRDGIFLSQSGKKTGDIDGEWPMERSNNHRGGILAKKVKESISEANGNRPVDITARREYSPSPMIMVVVRYAGKHSTFMVRTEEAVSVLRGKLQETQWKLPQRYELIHNLRVMDETRSFAFNHVLQGDLIQTWPQCP